MDRTTARIAMLLSPSAQIRHEDCTKAKLRAQMPDEIALALNRTPFLGTPVQTAIAKASTRWVMHS